MSVAILNVLLTVHISFGNRARFELVVIMSLSDVTSSHLACKVGDWAVIKEVSNLLTDFAPIVFLPVGHSETWCAMVESSQHPQPFQYGFRIPEYGCEWREVEWVISSGGMTRWGSSR